MEGRQAGRADPARVDHAFAAASAAAWRLAFQASRAARLAKAARTPEAMVSYAVDAANAAARAVAVARWLLEHVARGGLPPAARRHAVEAKEAAAWALEAAKMAILPAILDDDIKGDTWRKINEAYGFVREAKEAAQAAAGAYHDNPAYDNIEEALEAAREAARKAWEAARILDDVYNDMVPDGP